MFSHLELYFSSEGVVQITASVV